MKPLLMFMLYFLLASNLKAEEISKKTLEKNLKKHVLKLCGTPKPRNYKNIKSLNLARDYCRESFEDIGLEVSLQEFVVNNKKYNNVIGKLNLNKKKTVIVGSHYDVCGEQAGADDNASGVAGLIELARILKSKKSILKFNVEFVAYTLEEPPFFRTKNMGSYKHAQSIKSKLKSIEFMVCLEMIGYYTEKKNSQEYPIDAMKLLYPSVGNFIAVVGNSNSAQLVTEFKNKINEKSNVNCQGLVAPSILTGVDFSDHLNYWGLGVKAIMITDTSFYRNANYHKKTDLPQTLNYTKMTEVVKGLAFNFYK